MESSLTLAFSMQKNPGVYALLLGSGLSQSVGIPTGWEITQDLIQQIRAIGGVVADDVGYDELLGELGKTQDERNAILRGYFEPTGDEREEGRKLPSPAHRAIAQLVKDGYVKLILTTNFDRLMEIALGEIGVTPNVIRTDDMLKGAVPLRHSPITIVQLHGDYQDVRTLNTAQQLGTYSPEKNAFLNTVFEEYGLIVCGWSAKWDKALRDALYRIIERRYSVYWVEPHDLSSEATDLIHHREAEVIKATGDDFFVDLEGKIGALAKLNREHPLTVAVAVERVKKLLPREETQIELEDLLRDEAEQTYQKFSKLQLKGAASNPTEIDQFYQMCLSTYFAATETVLSMVTAICWYGKEQQVETVAAILNRWGTPEDINHELNDWGKIPALLLMYAAGMAAVYRQNWIYLRTLTLDATVISLRAGSRLPILKEIVKQNIFNYSIYPRPFHYADPISSLLARILRPLFRNYLPVDRDFSELFDLYEMLLALIRMSQGLGWIPHNAGSLYYFEDNEYSRHLKDFWNTGGRQGQDWGLLKVFFGGNEEALETALTSYQTQVANSIHSFPPPEILDYCEVYKSSFRELS